MGLGAALLLPGCGDGGSRRKSAAGGRAESGRKVLSYAIGNDLSNMDPALITDIESALVAQQVYEGLVKFKPDSVEVEPAIAEKWEMSEDGLKWTFHLRHNATFHDGSPVDADAVVFSVMRQTDSNHPFHVPGKMRYANFLYGDRTSTETQLVTDVSATDAHTVTFTLARPYTPFLKNMAMTPASIVCPAAVRTYGKDFNTTMVGTGPFALRNYRRDEAVTIDKNPKYWGTPAKLDEVRIRILRDANVRMNSLRKGEIDVISGIEPTAIPMLREDPAIAVISEPSMNLGYISLNNQRSPFDNPKVRLALCYAIDRQYIVNTLFAGSSVAAKTVIPPGMLGHSSELPGFPYDPGKAKALLAEAGFPNGFTVTFSSHDRPRIYYPVGIKLAERIQQDLSKVGVTTKIDQMEFSTFLSKTKAKDYQMANSGWVSDNGDPDNFIYELAGREDNDSNYVNPEATKLMRDASMEKDENKRAEMYKRAEQMLAANPPFIILNHAKQTLAIRKRVTNFKMHPTGVTQLAGIDI
ncbi:MAG: ABC transporter substrate-binding protein [Candidatus Sumerlaeaceae bacterium]